MGDYEAYNKLEKKNLDTSNVEQAELLRKIKIQAIPRILTKQETNVQVVSYKQISTILEIEKSEVEGYIIEAIQEGILNAKIDEFSETIIIKYRLAY